MKNIFKITGLLVAAVIVYTVQVNAQVQKAKGGVFALTNANIQTVTNGVINNGTIVLSGGKITEIGTNVTVPQGATTIDCKGLWIYPGMIDGGTRTGLLEFGQVDQASDEQDAGQIIPQMRALSAVNPNTPIIPVTRVSGVTTVIVYPAGGLIPGTASLMNLHGYVPDQMFAGFDGIVVNFPNTGRRGFNDRRTEDDLKKAAEKSLTTLSDTWDKAVQYHKIDSATKGKNSEYYPELQALMPAVRGQVPLMIEANAAKDILGALKWVKEKKVKKVILTGVAEGWRVADEIAKANIPVVTGPVLALPSRDYDRYDKAYANAGLMKKAGVKVALRTTDTENVRNLLYNAGFAAAYGLGKEEALKSVTITSAEIFGVSDKLGSLEKGKNATLFVCDGDPFETKTQVKHVFIDGYQMPMNTRQTDLYEEFLKRDPGVSKY
ncbi:MAG TPA: amidohydrolase family protein [Cyclobacteriaceae bacterium]|nr:amidohydrolase family protein [Cyclobacteriaceae bacterium]